MFVLSRRTIVLLAAIGCLTTVANGQPVPSKTAQANAQTKAASRASVNLGAKPQDFKLDWKHFPKQGEASERFNVRVTGKLPIIESSLAVSSCEGAKHQQYRLKVSGGPGLSPDSMTAFIEGAGPARGESVTLNGELNLICVTKTTKLESPIVPFVYRSGKPVALNHFL